ncbi:unnamed protein product [Gongylonema pulchrum]|uniref:Transmembrane protein n=1 Tax=Gongylonema pulchrum TaxID=637853 RepID=A0A183DC48_9BILA|nr:unnamed protein product [Gongylonema pulchrum]
MFVLYRKNNPQYAESPPESRCLPESSYTPILKRLKEERVLVIRPEGIAFALLLLFVPNVFATEKATASLGAERHG